MSFALLSCLELADVERAATEGSFGSFDACSLGILYTLVAHEAETKHVFAGG